MAKKSARDSEVKPRLRPAYTPEAKENQMIALAMDLVEERLRNGTATSQETTHFLKLGTVQAKLEKEKMEAEIELLKEKKKAIGNADETKALFEDAIAAFKRYSGTSGDDHD